MKQRMGKGRACILLFTALLRQQKMLPYTMIRGCVLINFNTVIMDAAPGLNLLLETAGHSCVCVRYPPMAPEGGRPYRGGILVDTSVFRRMPRSSRLLERALQVSVCLDDLGAPLAPLERGDTELQLRSATFPHTVQLLECLSLQAGESLNRGIRSRSRLGVGRGLCVHILRDTAVNVVAARIAARAAVAAGGITPIKGKGGSVSHGIDFA